MRLTLRTLLAYLDDILDPADKDELAQKIESSEFAEDLILRTRDTTRRLRLSAPQVLGTGMGLDPNTVAEYLDNVLPPESVGDFERICLESDVHLAEVASCHHVLTMVLGEPADIDPDTRQKMYSLPAVIEERRRLRIEAAHVPTAAQQPAGDGRLAGTAFGGTIDQSQAVEIPDYLRASSWSRYRVALAALAAMLLVAITLLAAPGLRSWFGGEATPPQVAASTEPAAPPAGVEEQTSATDQATPLVDRPPPMLTPGLAPPPMPPSEEPDRYAAADQHGEPDSDATTAGTAEPTPPLLPPAPTEDRDRYAADETQSADDTAAWPGVAPDRYDVAPPDEIPADPTDDTATARLPEATPPPLPPQGAPGTEEQPDAAAAGVERIAAVDTGPADLPDVDTWPGDELDAEPAEPAELGTYLGGKTVLLSFDHDAGSWFRVEPRSAVLAGDRLLALPAFRPKITLVSGIHLDMSGGTQIALATDSQSEPAVGIEVVYGRVVLINTASDENTVQLQLGVETAEARLARNATLAIEVERTYVPGHDPRRAPPPVTVRLYVPDGSVVWRDAAGERLVDQPSQWMLVDGATTDLVANAPPPEWIDQEPVAQRSELLGASVVENTLVHDRPADNQLLEIHQGHRRREVKSLATRGSMYVGMFVPFVDALRDSEQRPNWAAHIETLRDAMALSPESSDRVWRTLVDARGERAAADLFEMLCGYDEVQVGLSPEEVRSGAVPRLIDWLEHDNLDYRVLAWYNLREITGKTLLTNPAGSLRDRATGVRLWRQRLEQGDLGLSAP